MNSMRRRAFAVALMLAHTSAFIFCGEDNKLPKLAAASDEAEKMMGGYKVPKDYKISLFAAEPMLAHPVAMCVDERGRFFVAECWRFANGINGGGDRDYGAMDLRGHMDWLEEDLSNKTVADREAMLRKHMGDGVNRLTQLSEVVRMIEDRDGDGKADFSAPFATGFNSVLDGAAAGVLARKGNVWFTCIPNLWHLKEGPPDKKPGEELASAKKILHSGFGIRIAFLGHDLHGLCFGPDGKIYFSIGDRGSDVVVRENGQEKHFGSAACGSVFRCNPDGTEFEEYATGLRNPQKLCFDKYGNLFTGDNNADHGDSARWVYVVEGGDSGWRGGYQYITFPNTLGAWNSEKIWGEPFAGQAAYVVPPVKDIAVGPSGVAYYPGTGMQENFNDHFLLCDYRGVTGGILSFAVKPKGAGFELYDEQQFFWNSQVTDAVFGADGGVYACVWVGGVEKNGKGRIYRAYDPEIVKSPIVLETKKLLSEGMEKRSIQELADLLKHRDMRVRQEAQFELADRGADAIPILHKESRNLNQLATVHAIWALGQIAHRLPDQKSAALDPLVEFLTDRDAEICAQSAKILGEARYEKIIDQSIKLLTHDSARVKYFAALALGRCGDTAAIDPLFEMLRQNKDKDAWLRHAGIQALTWLAEKSADAVFAKATDASPSARMAALLVMRKMKSPKIAQFLKDDNFLLQVEAARAINDVPIPDAVPALAAVLAPDFAKKVEPKYKFKIEYYENIGGTEIRNLTSNAKYPDKPDSTGQATIFEMPLNRGNNYGARMTGLLTAPQTGFYTFWIATDDDGELRLSTDENPENAMRICGMHGSVPSRDWNRFPDQKSAPLLLQAGKKYYVEALVKEGGGNDFLAVGWQLPDSTTERPIGGGISDDPRPLLRRALNAAFRLGTPESAQLLADFATREDNLMSLRVEALGALAEWNKPSTRDRIVGLYRPLPPRGEITPAIVDAIRPHILKLLKDPAWEMQLAAVKAVGSFRVTGTGDILLDMVKGPRNGDVRFEALKSLALLGDEKIYQAVRRALASHDPKLRGEGAAQLAKLDPAAAVPVLEEAISKATNWGEKQSAIAVLADMKKPIADAVILKWMEKLVAGGAPAELQLDLVEAARISNDKDVKAQLATYETQLPKADEFAKFKVTLLGGEVEAGKKIFYDHAAAQCIRCHKLNGFGGNVGPELKEIGKKQTREYLLESLINPSEKIAQGYETVFVSDKDGKVTVGVLKSEDEKELVLMPADGKQVSIKKEDIKTRRSQKESTMPPMGEVLKPMEIRNLVEFLSSLK